MYYRNHKPFFVMEWADMCLYMWATNLGWFNRTTGIVIIKKIARTAERLLCRSIRRNSVPADKKITLTTPPHHDDVPPAQNHGQGCHYWWYSIVPPTRIALLGPCRGRFGGVLLETNFKLSYNTIYYTYHALAISDKWWPWWPYTMHSSAATLQTVHKCIEQQ